MVPVSLRQRVHRFRHRRRYDALRSSPSLTCFDNHQCIFIHIPRTGGVSISNALFGHLIGHHRTAEQYRCIFGHSAFRKYFKFTFVRNPWDRAVSAFSFLKAGGMDELDKQWARDYLSDYDNFDSFVRGWITPQNIRKIIHFVPQHEFIYSDDLRPFIDFTGRFEDLDADFQRVRYRLGLQTALQHMNASNRREYKRYYTRQSRDIIGEVYRTDIVLFGYDFGLPSKI